MDNNEYTNNSNSTKAQMKRKHIMQEKRHTHAQFSVHTTLQPAPQNAKDNVIVCDSSDDVNTESTQVTLQLTQKKLLFDHNATDSKNYQQHIRTYNMMFVFTSAGIKLNKSINDSRGLPTIRIQGQPCHRIDSLLPMPGKESKFAELYIFDTNNELQNRINAISQHNEIEADIVSSLSQMLDEHNTYAKSFRMARDRLTHSEVHNIRLKLIADREKDGRIYNVPTVSEVVALITGDFDTHSKRDIILETQNGQSQRIDELHSSYLDGYRPDILHRATSSGQKRKRNHLTMREWFAFRLQCRSNEAQTLLHSRKLFQQFVVKGYTMVESKRLSFIRHNKKNLELTSFPACNSHWMLVPPKAYKKVKGPRYMDQLYFDGMAIYNHVGYPNLFITLTSNPNWPEIHRLLTPLNLKATDRPNILSCIFKLKYEQMFSDLTKNHLLGKVVAYKKYPSSDDIDQMISAEIPSQEDDPELYTLVQNHMVHGPCGILRRQSPCMKEGRCNRFYPKMFQPHTLLDADGYPVYRRRGNGQTICKNGVTIDNRYIVPYNPKLLRR
uniref:Helitron helicase-like domain-containing protein n=1 Tax=Glycine max TaxID=3847 RepID=A0A0R0JJH4_SOYBN